MDTRIFYRFCKSLSQEFDVTLIARHPKQEVIEGVRIIPFRTFRNKYIRLIAAPLLMFFKALGTRARIYQIHDPELIPCGLMLRWLGKKVIYDVHENVAEDIFDKPWIRNKRMLHSMYVMFEKLAVRNCSVILAESSYEKRFRQLNARFVTVHNYCDVQFFDPFVNLGERNGNNLFYIGILLESRGMLQIAEALYLLKQRGRVFYFHCVGELYSDLYEKIYSLPYIDEIRSQLIFYGRQNLEVGYEISRNMGIGLCIIHPMKNSVESYPTKLFEYMAVGLPSIASDFPLYRSVVSGHQAGLCVDPMNPVALADAIEQLEQNPELRLQMAASGREAVMREYRWETEKDKALELYRSLAAR